MRFEGRTVVRSRSSVSATAIGFESFVDREVEGLIAGAHNLPSYDAWREQEYPWLRRLSESAS